VNAIDEEEFDQFDEIPPSVTSMIKPRIPLVNEAPCLRNGHHKKSRISKNQDCNRRLQNDCIKYAQCVKI
jgi:hypothetical protein